MNPAPLTQAQLQKLLVRTSRTFALAIPLLPEPTRTEVGLAYLLFRAADTVEDAPDWTRAERTRGLEEFLALLKPGGALAAKAVADRWKEDDLTDEPGCVELIELLPNLMASTEALAPGARDIIWEHVGRTTRGMRDIVNAGNDAGSVRLQSVKELQDYCYLVAGIVGELLTALFVHDAPALSAVKAQLEAEQRAFGEGLQLVNILKDQSTDAEAGRFYLPPQVPRAEILALAGRDLEAAARYIDTLRKGGAPSGFVAFTTMPHQLAEANLRQLETEGPGAKVPRSQVEKLLAKMQQLATGG